ncbi:Phosphopantetheine attachment site [Pseudomonas helmanticensis]|uniref:Phosphopantetheine attachment site n=1 Tax=Pseudomonas helmanticensis TaxID=1471381 RepID=A0ACD2U1T5_9PSED|nr:phosphopantetheine-binding protein [Pseudomonas helmanticensis]SMQ23675.1 Phosphopantetheine attachment site [Pseudomonas helmanticensis]
METLIDADLAQVVDEVLQTLASAKRVSPDAPLEQIVFDSLDQMRLLVAIEDRLQFVFDDAALQPFCLDSREALVNSVAAMMNQQG